MGYYGTRTEDARSQEFGRKKLIRAKPLTPVALSDALALAPSRNVTISSRYMASVRRETGKTYGGWLEKATPNSAASVLRSLTAMEIGAGSVDPLIAPLFVLLKAASIAVNKTLHRGKNLRDLLAVCAVITGRVMVIGQAGGSPALDVSPLKVCLEELRGVAEYYSHHMIFVNRASSLLYGDRIQDLRARIGRLVLTMGSLAVVAIGCEGQYTPVMSCASSPEAFPCYDHVLTPKSAGVVPKSLLEGLASMEVETAAPFIAPLLVVLKETGRAVEKAVLNRIELGDLLAHCTNITGNVIQRAQADSSSVDVSPLQKYIEELKKVAKLCGQKNTSASATRHLSDRIQNLRMRIDVVNIWHKVEDVSQTPARGSGVFILARHVDPGSTKLRSRERDVRITIHSDSLHRPIGPIKVHELAQVVKCRNDRKDYLLTTILDCQPSGIRFSGKPLLLDFLVGDAPSAAEIPQQFQVLVREFEASGWRKLGSKVHVDDSGRCFLRAAVKGFTCFSAAAVVNPADPFRTEVCRMEGMIGLGNASNVKAYFVFVPTSFDTDNMARDSHSSGGTVAAAGVSLGAAYGVERERATTRYRLPTGTTPSEFIILPGGSLEFSPPTGSSGGQLVIAMLPSQTQSASPVQVVDYYAQFPVRQGHTKIVLQGCLDGGRLNRADVVAGEKLVNAVLQMANLRPEGRDAATTVESSPQSAISRAAPSLSLPIEAPSTTTLTTAVAATLPSAAQSQGGIMRNCLVS